MDEAVIARVDGRVGRLTLNRPRALNALNHGMIAAMVEALTLWRDRPDIHAVVIDSASDRAFCAGGDIRAIRQAALAGDHAEIETFFAAEYALNRMLAEYPKPYVALIDGICMGGGIGISVHGQIRVATESAVFAMPETGIALFPDVGATFLLPRLPGRLGLYLGLTGARLTGGDAVHAGLATHLVARHRLPALSAALAMDGVAALARFAVVPEDFSLAPHRTAIDRCFGAPDVIGILAALADEGEFGATCLAALRAASPSAVLWSYAAICRGAGLSLAACLDAELRLTRGVTAHPDFSEGVRAMLVDKDRAPHWRPERIEDVDSALIDRLLAW
jgi:enoyl-CoA hydratase/carnithine racemase